ncbi:hypothetical protein [Mycoplasma sp. 5370]
MIFYFMFIKNNFLIKDNLKIINLLLKSILKVDIPFIIQGSFSFYLDGFIDVKPNDLDILFPKNNQNLKEKNTDWEKIEETLNIEKSYINNEVYKSYLIKKKFSKIKLEIILSKEIKPIYYKKHPILNFYYTNEKYRFASKLSQIFKLTYLYEKNIYFRKKLLLSLKLIEQNFNFMKKTCNLELWKYFKDNIISDLYFQLLGSKMNFYKNYEKILKNFEKFKIEINNFPNLKKFLIYLIKRKRKFFEKIEVIFELRDSFFSVFLTKNKLENIEQNYGLNFFLNKQDKNIKNKLELFQNFISDSFHKVKIEKYYKNEVLSLYIVFNFYTLVLDLLKTKLKN